MEDENEKRWSEAFSRHNGSRERGWQTNREAKMNSERKSNPSGKKSSRKSAGKAAYANELVDTVQDLKDNPDTKNITVQQVVLEDGTPMSTAIKAELDPISFRQSDRPSFSRRNVSNEVPTRPSQSQFIPKEKGRAMTIAVKRNHGAARKERLRNEAILQAELEEAAAAEKKRIRDEDKAAKLAAKQAAKEVRPSRKLPSRRISETDDVFTARVEAEGFAAAQRSQAIRSMKRAVTKNEKEARRAYQRGQMEAKGVGRYVVSNIRRGMKQTVDDIDTDELKEKAGKALTAGKKVGGAAVGVARKYATRSTIRFVGHGAGTVLQVGAKVVGETANAIGDMNMKNAQAYAMRNGIYQDGEKTKRVYYYPDGTVKEVVETQKPGTVRRSGTADKKKLGPGNLGPKEIAQVRGKPGPGRRIDTLGRRSAKTIDKNQNDLVKVQNGLGGGKKKDGPVNKPKGGPGAGKKGGPAVRRENLAAKSKKALPVRSKRGLGTNNTPKDGPKRRSGYKPVNKQRSVNFAMKKRSRR